MKWFQHDSNARNDIKLKKLYRRYGSDGKDLYWDCIEMIAEKLESRKDFTLEETSDDLAIEKGWDVERVDAILNYCLELELFDREVSSKRIRCLKILARLDNTISRCSWIKNLINSALRFKSESLRRNYVATTCTEEEIEKKIKEKTEDLERLLGRKASEFEISQLKLNLSQLPKEKEA